MFSCVVHQLLYWRQNRGADAAPNYGHLHCDFAVQPRWSHLPVGDSATACASYNLELYRTALVTCLAYSAQLGLLALGLSCIWLSRVCRSKTVRQQLAVSNYSREMDVLVQETVSIPSCACI